jgi:uncharacterized protein YbjT (DUF2867 family)
MTRRALLLGATGLVGSRCLEALCAGGDYDAVTVLSRRPLDVSDPRVRVQVLNLEDMGRHPELFAVEDIFCCLGTTLSKAGSRGAFYHVDHDLCLQAARLGADQGARNFLLVSAINANRRSPFFYPRAKGETEADVAAAGLPAVHLFQPSFLLGERDEKRPAEWLGIQAMRVVQPAFHVTRSRLTPVSAERLAGAMVKVALEDRPAGIYRYRYADFLAWSRVGS